MRLSVVVANGRPIAWTNRPLLEPMGYGLMALIPMKSLEAWIKSGSIEHFSPIKIFITEKCSTD